MKNTTFRKKALLSSVAMLLVALVALGSATFAWFAANPNAEAAGLSLKTTASTGLVVKTDSFDIWSHNAILNAAQDSEGNLLKNAEDEYYTSPKAFDLQPVSQDQTTPANFWTVAAKDSGDEVYDPNATMTSASVGTYKATGAVYSEKIYFRLSDGSAATIDNVYLTGVTITKNANATMENAIRVAVVNNENQLLGTYCISSAGANGTLTTAAKTAGDFNPALSTAVGKDGVKVVDGADLTADAADKDNYVTVYVYLDGQDADCYSDKVGTVNATQIISGIDLDFKLKAAPANP